MEENNYKLTQYSHGAGCGCKIAPQVLEEILKSNNSQIEFKNLIVGNDDKDDAAVMLLSEEEALISTTDFFTPIVDDAYIFGQVAAANAISDVYAMGGKPIMALAILGWPVEQLPTSIAQQVLEGARNICNEAGIPLAGGHSIDSKEPIFGLSVNGIVHPQKLKQNNTAQVGDVLLLTKPLGVGILSTAAKREKITTEDLATLHHQLIQLNKIGFELGQCDAVHAMTDVTGFGIAGHFIEMCEGSGLSAIIEYGKIPKLEAVNKYLAQSILPDATYRNWNGYGNKIQIAPEVNYLEAFQLLPDPQTNGGLLIAVDKDKLKEVQSILSKNGYEAFVEPIGTMTAIKEKSIFVSL
ncbi:MAG TPA: selenide, water dikinase SelD [Edaphocola sp.]|nr:selenide, water dikinase SelD [Edaphocola sp.]